MFQAKILTHGCSEARKIASGDFDSFMTQFQGLPLRAMPRSRVAAERISPLLGLLVIGKRVRTTTSDER